MRTEQQQRERDERRWARAQRTPFYERGWWAVTVILTIMFGAPVLYFLGLESVLRWVWRVEALFGIYFGIVNVVVTVIVAVMLVKFLFKLLSLGWKAWERENK